MVRRLLESDEEYSVSEEDDSDDDYGEGDETSNDEGPAVKKRKRRLPAVKNRATSKTYVKNGTRHSLPATSKKGQKRRQRQAGNALKERDNLHDNSPTTPAKMQFQVVREMFGDDHSAASVDCHVTRFRDTLLAGARGALARRRGQDSAGDKIAVILDSMYRAAYRFIAQAAVESGAWADDDVELLQSLQPPQSRQELLDALSSIPSCNNVLLVISKCAAGEHVAMAPDGPHATLLHTAERAGGSGTVVLDVAQRVLLCRRASKGGSCEDLDKNSGLCEVTDKAERRLAAVFVAVLLELLAGHVLPSSGRILLAVNHSGWPEALSFVHEQRRKNAALARSLLPTIFSLAHYRYIIGEVRCMEGRSHLALGYLLAAAVASGEAGLEVLEAVGGWRVNTYKETWLLTSGKSEIDAPFVLLSTAESLLDSVAGVAFKPAPPRTLVDLSETFLTSVNALDELPADEFDLSETIVTSVDLLYELAGDEFSHQIALLRRWYHEFTSEDCRKGANGCNVQGCACTGPDEDGGCVFCRDRGHIHIKNSSVAGAAGAPPASQGGMYGVSRDKEGKQLQFEATLKSCLYSP